MKLLLIRHGESVDDILDCYGGAADYPLSEAGMQTANDLSESIKTLSIQKIYSSPLKRAIQTSEVIDKLQNCGIITISGLKERNSYGVMSGCTKSDCKEIYAYLLKDMIGKPGDYYSDELVLGAEEKAEFDKRVRLALITVANDAMKSGYETVAVVTHGNVTRSIYKNILGVKGKIDLDLLAKTFISYDGSDKFTLISKEGVYEESEQK